MARSLIILPDDSAKPILDAINNAKKSLRIKMFTFSDPMLLQAVIAAHQRGVKVWVMLNAARRSGEDDNKIVRKALTRAGVEVKESNPAFVECFEADRHRKPFKPGASWPLSLTTTSSSNGCTRSPTTIGNIRTRWTSPTSG
jgi:hypothetical protein